MTLVRVDDAPSFLASLEQAKAFLAACSSLDEAKGVRDKAQAVMMWARAQKDAGELEVAAGELRVRATVRMGELLPPKPTPEESGARGGRGNEKAFPSETPFSRKEAHVARAVAAVPVEIRERVVSEAKARGEAPTVAAILRAAGKSPDAPAFVAHSDHDVIVRAKEIKRAAREEKVAAVVARAEVDEAAKPLGSGLYSRIEDAPSGLYRTIYMDPPWSYEDESVEGAAAQTYDTMTLEQMLALDVARLGHAEGSHLWMWTTWPKLRDGEPHRLLEAWGYRWVGELVWHKGTPSIGRWLRSITEVCVLAVRGSVPLLVNGPGGFVQAARGRHSEKPAEARAFVEMCSPGPRLEVFARRVPEGWDAVGNQVERVTS